MDRAKISIILPARNAQKYIGTAIKSVLSQDYTNWELLVVDNDSTDNTAAIVRGFEDKRIQLHFEELHAVAYARNRGLKNCTGEYFCFLDADDSLPPHSISSRVSVFENKPNAQFVDGKVTLENETMDKVIDTFEPSFSGVGLRHALLTETDSCFMGMSWMVRNKEGNKYAFDTRMTHCEDLLFCLQHSEDGAYFSTHTHTYRYRQHAESLMRNLSGLEEGYRHVCHWGLSHLTPEKSSAFSQKCKSTMVKSYLKAGKIRAASQLYWSQFP